jgi:hypothetical protein
MIHKRQHIGCDYHPGFQQIAFVDADTGELSERRLGHREQAEELYQELKQRNVAVRVGMEASGHARWLEVIGKAVVTMELDEKGARLKQMNQPTDR